MRGLEDIKLGHRVMLTVAIVVILIIVLGITGCLIGGWDEAQGQEPKLYSGDVPYDQHLIERDRVALEKAYDNHLQKLFAVWLTEGADDSTRFRNGLRIARRAYGQAATAIEKRQQELKSK